MNHLGVSVAPTSLTKALDVVGEDFDVNFKVWKERLSCHLSKEMETKKELEILEQQVGDRETTVGEDSVGPEKAALNQKIQELNTLQKKHPPNFAIVIDNFNLRVEAADMTSDNQNKDLHWVNHSAILDRVPCTEFGNEKPLADNVNIPNKTFLPTLHDHFNLMKDFEILVSRVLVKNLPYFQNIFSDIVPQHIPHKHSQEMKLKSKKVNLGILFKNENKGEDMIDILRYLQGLVPSHGEDEKEVFERFPVVGDQLTVERGVEAQFSVSNAYTPGRRLEGIYFQLADWHHENKFLDVSSMPRSSPTNFQSNIIINMIIKRLVTNSSFNNIE